METVPIDLELFEATPLTRTPFEFLAWLCKGRGV
jgi:hypothetical protein